MLPDRDDTVYGSVRRSQVNSVAGEEVERDPDGEVAEAGEPTEDTPGEPREVNGR